MPIPGNHRHDAHLDRLSVLCADEPRQNQDPLTVVQTQESAILCGSWASRDLLPDAVGLVAEFGEQGDRAAPNLPFLSKTGATGDVGRIIRVGQFDRLLVDEHQPPADEDGLTWFESQAQGHLWRRKNLGHLAQTLAARHLPSCRLFGPGIGLSRKAW
jgi:hypothetical protein